MSTSYENWSVRVHHHWSLDHVLGAKLFGRENFCYWAHELSYYFQFTGLLLIIFSLPCAVVLLFLDPENVELPLCLTALTLPYAIHTSLFYDVRLMKTLLKESFVWLNVLLLVSFVFSFLFLVNIKSKLPVITFSIVMILHGMNIVFTDSLKASKFTVIGLPFSQIAYVAIFEIKRSAILRT